MKSWLLAAAAAVLAATSAHAGDSEAEGQVARAERAFAADTKVMGYHRGFLTWSAPDAVGFFPQAANYHDRLTAALAADPSLADKPTALRWWPFLIGVSQSGDLAYDLGAWRIEGGDDAGWFLTMWRRQSDGSWKWVLDNGAGSDAAAGIPSDGQAMWAWASSSSSPSASEGLSQDDAFNAQLAATPADQVFLPLRNTVIASPGVPPYIPGYKMTTKDGLPDDKADSDRRATAVAARPTPGQAWTRDGSGASSTGDMVYTYGHVVAADGSYLGHYVRVWQKLGATTDTWRLTVDDYQSAK